MRYELLCAVVLCVFEEIATGVMIYGSGCGPFSENRL
jgi:hypothetical protein